MSWKTFRSSVLAAKQTRRIQRGKCIECTSFVFNSTYRFAWTECVCLARDTSSCGILLVHLFLWPQAKCRGLLHKARSAYLLWVLLLCCKTHHFAVFASGGGINCMRSLHNMTLPRLLVPSKANPSKHSLCYFN